MTTTEDLTLYRTVVRVVAVDSDRVEVAILAWDPHLTVELAPSEVPAWLLTKEVGYRFFARVPIYAEAPEQIRLVDCENDPRTRAEQVAALQEFVNEATR